MGLSFEAGRAALGVEVDGDVPRLRARRRRHHARARARRRAPAGVGSYAAARRRAVAPTVRSCASATRNDGDILHFALRVLDADDRRRGRRARGRGPAPGRRRLVAGAGRPAARVHQRARRLRAPGDLGPRHGRASRHRRRPAGRRLPAAVVARTGRRCSLRHEFEGRGAVAPARRRDRRGDGADRPRRRSSRAARACAPTATCGIHQRRRPPARDRGRSTARVVLAPRRAPARGPAVREPVRDQPARRSDPHARRHARRARDRSRPCSTSTAAPSGTNATVFDPEVAGVRRPRLRGRARELPRARPATASRFARRSSATSCLTESEDILACLDALVADGTDRPRARRTGAAGPGAAASRASTPACNPDRFRAIFAGIPAGDFVAAHWASAPELQAWDDAVYGGSPDEAPESYRRATR